MLSQFGSRRDGVVAVGAGRGEHCICAVGAVESQMKAARCGVPSGAVPDRRALANMALAFIRLARRSAERAGMDTKARSALQAASRMPARGRSTPKVAMLVQAQRRNWQGARSRRARADPSLRSRSG